MHSPHDFEPGYVSHDMLRGQLSQCAAQNQHGDYPAKRIVGRLTVAVATDLVTGREIWLQDGPIDQAVRASIALPGIFGPARTGDKWLVDGGLSNPVPVSVCRAMGADVIIAVNLNGDLVGRRFQTELDAPAAATQLPMPGELISRLLQRLPTGLREQAASIVPRLLQHEPASLGYFDVLANSINIMQDHITRARLAGEPPHVMLLPRLQHITLMESIEPKKLLLKAASVSSRRCR
jgi:NTE family protein